MRRTIGFLGKWVIIISIAAVCCAGGVVVSRYLHPALQTDSENDEPAPEQENTTEATQLALPAVSSVEAGFAQVDQLIMEGRYADARATGEMLQEKTTGVARDALDYRFALCLEASGQQNEALSAYQTLVDHASDTPVGAAATVGLARIWLQAGKTTRAREVLADLLLRAGRPPLRGHAILSDATYLLSLTLARDAIPAEMPGPANTVPAHSAIELSLESALAAVKWNDSAPQAETGYVAPVVQKTGPKPETWTVTATVRQAVAHDFLDEVSRKAGLHVEWNGEARQQASTRTLTVAAEQMPLLDVLRAAAAAMNLSHELVNDKLTFSLFPAVAVSPVRQTVARRSLLEAAAAYPEHPWAPVAAVELGNLEMVADRLKEASSWYERLIHERPRAKALKEAYYNLGLVRARLGERESARDAFYRVIDRDPMGPLAPLSYLHIGRSYLEEANPALAARALRRVLMVQSNSLTRTAAGLTLAAAELLDDNPRAAHAAIVDIRQWVGEEPFIRPAALLDALARYRATTNSKFGSRTANDLLSALLAYREDSLLGAIGLVLAGQGYRDLDLGDEMMPLFKKAIPGVGKALALSMKADMADHLIAAGRKDAVPLLQVVAATSGPRAARAELRLAEVALKENRPDECLSRCRKILTGGGPESSQAARLMGQAYTHKGNYVAAASCYAGRPPASEQNDSTNQLPTKNISR